MCWCPYSSVSAYFKQSKSHNHKCDLKSKSKITSFTVISNQNQNHLYAKCFCTIHVCRIILYYIIVVYNAVYNAKLTNERYYCFAFFHSKPKSLPYHFQTLSVWGTKYLSQDLSPGFVSRPHWDTSAPPNMLTNALHKSWSHLSTQSTLTTVSRQLTAAPILRLLQQDVTITGRNRTGPPCSVGRLPDRPRAWRSARPLAGSITNDDDRRQTPMSKTILAH